MNKWIGGGRSSSVIPSVYKAILIYNVICYGFVGLRGWCGAEWDLLGVEWEDGRSR